MFELSSSPCLLSPSPHLNSTYLLVLALFNMVHSSDKQELLEDIKMAILATLLVETELKRELASTVDTCLPNDDLNNSDDGNFDHVVSQALITTHSIINNKQYTDVKLVVQTLSVAAWNLTHLYRPTRCNTSKLSGTRCRLRLL